jgi:phage gp36-like protein
MAVSPPFALTSDVEARFPSEAAVLCADEASRLPDWTRFDAALGDVSTEMRAILAKRYSVTDLADVDEDSAALLKLFAIDMAMYRVALSYARSTEQIKERYEVAVKRLEAMALGRGGLTFVTPSGVNAQGEGPGTSPNEVIVIAPPRQFGRSSRDSDDRRRW